MSEPQCGLIFGDAYRCEQALSARHAAILTEFSDTERVPLFGDELNLPALRMTLLSRSLFVQGRHFVVRHAEAVSDPKLFACLLAEALPEATFLTLLADDLRPSNPILKMMKDGGGRALALPRKKGKALERAAGEILAERGQRLTPAAVKELVADSGGDLLAVYQEAGKLHAFAREGVCDEDAAARLFFSAGERSIYPLLDRIGEGNLPAALGALSRLHEDPGRTFSALLRHLTRVLMVGVLAAEGAATARVAALLRSPSWLIQRLLNQAKRHATQGLCDLVRLGVELDLAIKSGGIRPEDALLKLVLAATTPVPPVPECARRSRPVRAASG